MSKSRKFRHKKYKNYYLIIVYMKDSSNTNDLFDGADDNFHFDPDIILPFLENDVLKIQFEY